MALAVFPSLPGIGWPKGRDEEWKSQIEEAIGGQKTGYSYWTYPRRHYKLVVNFMRSAIAYQEWQSLVAFFNSQKGSAGIWLYDDPADDSVANQNFGTGDGATATFQLVRALGGNTVPVFALNGSPTVKVNGVVTSVTVGNLGTVTFASAPASGASLTWSGSYYWICRFETDTLSTEEFMSSLHDAKEVKFVTEKF